MRPAPSLEELQRHLGRADVQQIEPLASVYPPPRFYADPEQMRDAIQWGTLFNIIDTTAENKFD